jgi:hypothetical protein
MAVVITGGLLARQLVASKRHASAGTPTEARRAAAAAFHLLYLVPKATAQLASLDAVAQSVRMYP